MADIKISNLTNVTPVVDGMIIPISYKQADATYKSGSIVTEDIKKYVSDDLENKFATQQEVADAISEALTGGDGGDSSIFASVSYVNEQDEALSNRIKTLEEIDHSVYALNSDVTALNGTIEAMGNKAVEDANKYTDEKFAAIDLTPYAKVADVNSHVNNGDIHVTVTDKTNWNEAKKAIDAFIKAEGVHTDAIDTLVEIQEYITNDGAAADLMTKNIAANTQAIATEKSRAEAAEAQILVDAKAYADGLAGNYDAKGAAATAETNAKAYADGLAGNYDAKGAAATAETNAKAYADEKFASIEIPEVDLTPYAKVVDVNEHVNNSDIHVTTEDKAKWNAAAAQSALEAALLRIAALEAKLAQYDERFGYNDGNWTVNFLQID